MPAADRAASCQIAAQSATASDRRTAATSDRRRRRPRQPTRRQRVHPRPGVVDLALEGGAVAGVVDHAVGDARAAPRGRSAWRCGPARRPRSCPRWPTSRSTATSTGTSTTTTRRHVVRAAVGRAAGCRARRRGRCRRSAAMRRAISARTAGWTIALRSSSALRRRRTRSPPARPGRARRRRAMMSVAEALGELVEQRRARLLQLVDDRVGVDDHRAALGEQLATRSTCPSRCRP